ncbi:hypothetical protein I4U23_024923 [Adineta vaga]|nr:hypothetical protein I4U23_024923 [Adineta vaga]
MVISFLTYRLLSILIGILYPSYQTYKSLKYQCYDQYQSYENDIDYLFNNTIHRLTDICLKLIVFILNQQRTISTDDRIEKSNEQFRIKTNFASQYRRMNSIQR